MDMEGEGDEGLREEETMVGKEGSVLMGFYLGEEFGTRMYSGCRTPC